MLSTETNQSYHTNAVSSLPLSETSILKFQRQGYRSVSPVAPGLVFEFVLRLKKMSVFAILSVAWKKTGSLYLKGYSARDEGR